MRDICLAREAGHCWHYYHPSSKKHGIYKPANEIHPENTMDVDILPVTICCFCGDKK